ncbi:sn-glycerol-3-phosphate ABC transporter ATP-binding protein UgpC [Ignavibacteria bacterium 4148-Me]|uniref:ABC transporter ATP-binding protein n=1 Tax=Rosettibacter primus TaxID=3111523 RepID=UPI00336BC4FF
MASVELKNIFMTYGEVKILDNFNLSIKDGEFLVLVGPTGCGKTTTLRIIAGLEEPLSGDVFIGEKCITNVPPKDRDIAMVFQNYALYPHMNVFDNMAFGLTIRKLPKEDIKKRVYEAAEILNIKDILHRKPKELSGGQRQRVALGRAIVRQPKVFLFDEPLSNLDAKLRAQMRSEIKKLHQKLRTTMVYVTHDQIEAMTMGDRIVVMKDGLIMQMGTATELYEKPNNVFVASFIGSPSMNFFEVEVIKSENIILKNDCFTLKLHENVELQNYFNKKILIGIRPENIQITNEEENIIKGTVDVVEWLGDEALVYASNVKNNFVSKSYERHSFRVGDQLNFKPDITKLHFFDLKTGDRVNAENIL